MAVTDDFLTYVLDQLSEFGAVEIKRMFGGVGLYKDGVIFGIIGNDTFRLKVDQSNQKDYEEKGMKPFYSEKMKKGMPYWEVPQDVLENRTMLANWATRSLEISFSSGK